MHKDESAFLIADHDVRVFFVMRETSHHLGADSRIVIDAVRDPLDLAITLARKLEPIKISRGQRIHIPVRSVRPESFARNDILQTVAVHVD